MVNNIINILWSYCFRNGKVGDVSLKGVNHDIFMHDLGTLVSFPYSIVTCATNGALKIVIEYKI